MDIEYRATRDRHIKIMIDGEEFDAKYIFIRTHDEPVYLPLPNLPEKLRFRPDYTNSQKEQLK